MYANFADEMFYRRAVWYKQFAWLPRRCALSRELIWLKFAYQGTAMFYDSRDTVIEYKWIVKEHFLFARLAGKL